ncbi:MAG: MBL fold metallo-hydrolase [Spirochaetota bacterium]|nr:MBL fold metallo-hydrolase [Spirochaetota bacterium]
MKITFWGVRGTLPTPDLDKMKTGGNTTCVEVRINNNIIIFDAGTGIVNLGRSLLKEFEGKQLPTIYIFLTHTHWDHLDGFPFFSVLFCKDVQVKIYGPMGKNRRLEELICTQMDDDFCPISYTKLPAFIDYFEIGEEEIQLPNDIKIISKKHIHPGGAYSYRLEHNNKVFVFNTDIEHYNTRLDQRVVEISQDADLMVHDAQYTEDQIEDHIGWGHSTWQQAVEVANLANVKMLGLTHHDLERTDKEINVLEKKVKKVFENSFFCREKMSIEL